MQRCFVVFPEETMRMDAQPMLDLDAERYRPAFPQAAPKAERTLIADLSEEQRKSAEAEGAEIYEDVLFEITANPLQTAPERSQYWMKGIGAPAAAAVMAAPWQSKSLDDVLAHINAPGAWGRSRGSGVTIGIIDTGVSSTMPEFPAAKRSPFSKSFAYSTPWADPQGHGSMCACIATGTKSAGGLFDGVAPDATLMSLRSNLWSTDIYMLYDWVLTNRRSGALTGPIVLSNSYGSYTCSPPAGLPTSHPYLGIVRSAISDGIVVVFAAGNNHHDVLCNHDPSHCSPNTIWGVNSVDEVLSIGTVNWNEKMDSGDHANSSRGPGQWAVTHPKPDCVAPTYGKVVWGSGYQTMEWWGTSGACPQVAGLAALMLSVDPGLTPANLADAIRSTCRSIGLGATCAGAGIIDCAAAVGSLP